MDEYRQLQEHLRALAGGGKSIAIYQGIVKSVDGNLCEVTVGGITIPGVRLKASEIKDDGLMLVTPKVGSAVTIGSLSGDLRELVVLQVDHIETIVINGGKLGGLINIGQLTQKINELVEAFNNHTHQVTVSHPGGTFTTVKPTDSAKSFNKGDYEDEKNKALTWKEYNLNTTRILQSWSQWCRMALFWWVTCSDRTKPCYLPFTMVS